MPDLRVRPPGRVSSKRRILPGAVIGATALGLLTGTGWVLEDEPGPAAAAELIGQSQLADLDRRLQLLESKLGIDMAPQEGDLRAQYAALVERERALAATAEEALAFVPDRAPVEGGVITSGYVERRYHPVLRRVRPHSGVDFSVPYGTPVVATAAGTVRAIGRTPEYGLRVDVDHGNGFITRYAHLSQVVVSRGTEVRKGETLGRAGSSGLTTGPVVHYEVYWKDRARDPVLFLPASQEVESELAHSAG